MVIFAGLAGIAGGGAAFAEEAESSVFSAKETQAIETVIHNYILQNPEVVLESIAIMQEREQAEAEARTQAALIARRAELKEDPRDPVLGNPDGSLTVVEFLDYQCGYCKSMKAPVQAMLNANPHVRLVVKEFPILGEASVYAARASLAAKRQGLYEPFHVELLGLRGRLTEDAVLQVAQEVGLDLTQLRADMNDPSIAAHIEENYALAQALSIEGTPAFVIGDQLMPGAIPEATLMSMVGEQGASAKQ